MDYHRFIIGQRGREVRQMMDEFDVNISIPSPDDNSDIIKVTGSPANVIRAEKGLAAKVQQLDADKEDRVRLVINIIMTCHELMVYCI